MVLFSPKSLPPVSLRHNGRWIRLQESQRPDWKPDWFSLLIQLSWCRDGFTRMYLSTGVCQQRQGAIKTRSDHFFFLLIVASLANLAACLAVKRVNQPRLTRALRHQLLLLSCFFFSFVSLGCYFFSASQRHRCRVDWAPTLLYIN